MTAAPSNDSYHKAIEFLHNLQWFGTTLGLENTFRLAELAGNPQNKLRFIHVAGTNGKGSTCAMLESIYRAAGLQVGLFTSPHLISFRERIQVNRELISEADVARLVDDIQPLLKQFSREHHPTFFEVVTVMALRHFAGQKCDLVIWETGLGGRLDATNIVTPLASVITNIALDHQQWLGNTLEKIAAEKAGIIKAGVPVITAADQPEVLKVIGQIAREKNAPLNKVGQASRLSRAGGTPALPLLGQHQKLNAAIAAETVKVLQKQIPVSEEQLRHGLSQLNWPGRLQLVDRGDQKILLDGAHNIASTESLRAALKENFPQANATLVLGILRDKDWPQMCEILAPIAKKIFTVPVSSERTASPTELAEACGRANPKAEVTICSSLANALEITAAEKFLIVTGSLYLVGEAMELLGLSEARTSNERRLNEWSAKPVPVDKS